MKFMFDVKLGMNVADEVIENDDVDFDEAVKDGRIDFDIVDVDLYDEDGENLFGDAEFKETMMGHIRDMVKQLKEGELK